MNGLTNSVLNAAMDVRKARRKASSNTDNVGQQQRVNFCQFYVDFLGTHSKVNKLDLTMPQCHLVVL